jgi:hypothetical protein
VCELDGEGPIGCMCNFNCEDVRYVEYTTLLLLVVVVVVKTMISVCELDLLGHPCVALTGVFIGTRVRWKRNRADVNRTLQCNHLHRAKVREISYFYSLCGLFAVNSM